MDGEAHWLTRTVTNHPALAGLFSRDGLDTLGRVAMHQGCLDALVATRRLAERCYPDETRLWRRDGEADADLTDLGTVQGLLPKGTVPLRHLTTLLDLNYLHDDEKGAFALRLAAHPTEAAQWMALEVAPRLTWLELCWLHLAQQGAVTLPDPTSTPSRVAPSPKPTFS